MEIAVDEPEPLRPLAEVPLGPQHQVGHGLDEPDRSQVAVLPDDADDVCPPLARDSYRRQRVKPAGGENPLAWACDRAMNPPTLSRCDGLRPASANLPWPHRKSAQIRTSATLRGG